MIQNLLFIVEGKTEGFAQAFGKGLQNILRRECQFMREKRIRFHTIRKNGKSDLLSNVGFDVKNHLYPPKKTCEKLQKQGSAVGDFVFILRDLDCCDETKEKNEIFGQISEEFQEKVEVHFAVQEIEAWFFADPEGFSSVYKNPPQELVKKLLKEVPEKVSPEKAIDCDPKPSKILEKIAESLNLCYRKTIEGPQGLLEIDPDKVAKRCHHFEIFLISLRKKIGFLA